MRQYLLCLLTIPNKMTYSLLVLRPGWNTHLGPSLSRGASEEDRARFSSAGEEIVSSPKKKKKKKKKHKEADNSNDPIEEEEQVVDPNSISTSDAETEDVAEPKKEVEKNDPPEVREEEALISARNILEKTSLQGDTGRNENHGYRNA